MSIDPPEADWASFKTLSDVIKFAGLQGDTADKDTIAGSLCYLLGSDGSDHPRIFALIAEPDFAKLLEKWKVPVMTGGALSLQDPTPRQSGQGALVGRTCRVVVGLGSGQASPGPAASPPAPVQVPKRKVKLSTIINQTDDLEVDILDDAAITAAYARYAKKIGAAPPPDQELSAEQLTTLHSLFQSGRAPYTDMAVWGPYHHRLAKKIRLKGVRLNSLGEIVPVEINGPPDFEAWRESYGVFKTGCIMFGQISPARLDCYEHHIRSYHERYGRGCWALLYQADVRARLELSERLRRQGQEEKDAASAAGGSHDYDAKTPWEWVWNRMVKEHSFWHRELEEPALLILAKSQRTSQVLGADAPVEAPSGAAPEKPSSSTAALKRRRDDSIRQHLVGEDGMLTHNRRGTELCRGYQKGECKDKDRNGFCAKTGRTRHQCAKCLSEDHGANECPHGAPKQPRTFKPKGGRKGGGKSKA